MRDILFRGKRTDDGEWVYGDIDQYNHDDICIMDSEGYLHGIDRKTIGQFTGVYDFDGKRIFEGDEIMHDQPGEVEAKSGVVRFGEYGRDIGFSIDWFGWEPCLRQDLGFWVNERKIRVYGTIYD